MLDSDRVLMILTYFFWWLSWTRGGNFSVWHGESCRFDATKIDGSGRWIWQGFDEVKLVYQFCDKMLSSRTCSQARCHQPSSLKLIPACALYVILSWAISWSSNDHHSNQSYFSWTAQIARSSEWVRALLSRLASQELVAETNNIRERWMGSPTDIGKVLQLKTRYCYSQHMLLPPSMPDAPFLIQILLYNPAVALVKDLNRWITPGTCLTLWTWLWNLLIIQIQIVE